MSVLSLLMNTFTDFWTAFTALFIAYVIYKLSKFYWQVYCLPPGPFPLPLFGNILGEYSKELQVSKPRKHWIFTLEECKKRYGPVFTFWMGHTPYVIITDIDIGREAYLKNDFAGRHQTFSTRIFSNAKYQDILFTDLGPTWETLRRVSHKAVQKYSANDKLVYLVTDIVDTIVKDIMTKEGINREINPTDFIFEIFFNIMGNNAFANDYHTEDKDFLKLKTIFKDFFKEVGRRSVLWDYSKILRLLDWKLVKKHQENMSEIIAYTNKMFTKLKKDYDESIERCFCDALITAKNDALRDGKESANYLTDENLAMSLFDLLIAGTDTSQITFQWIVLFIAYYPEIQKKLRKEIESQIGDRIPTHEDRNRCHYVMAFIAEMLRIRNSIPTGVIHKAVVKSKLGDHMIPKGTAILLAQGMILTDDRYWPNAKEFRPERFLENGKYVTTRHKAFIPFGVGRRVCLGEKLAIADLFLVLVRFLQNTSDFDIVLGQNGGLDADSGHYLCIPKDYNIILMSRTK